MVLYENTRKDVFRRKVTVNLSDDGTQLHAFCCDLGPEASDFWKSTGIEFTLSVKGPELEKFEALIMPVARRENLLPAMAEKFKGDGCFTDLKYFLDEHQVKYELDVWR